MTNEITGKKVAILATDGFEESELQKPLKALKDAGAEPLIISLKEGKIKGWTEQNWGSPIQVDLTVEQANPDDFDAIVLPGGVMNPDKLRMNSDAVSFVQHFVDQKKPIAAICHGLWTLIETGAVNGRKVTSYPSVKTDLINAGAHWVDQEVVVDKGLVTSRNPNDLPAFCAKMIEEIAEGRHDEQHKKPFLEAIGAELFRQ